MPEPVRSERAKEIWRTRRERDAAISRNVELEAILIAFINAGVGNSIDLVAHKEAFSRARSTLNR